MSVNANRACVCWRLAFALMYITAVGVLRTPTIERPPFVFDSSLLLWDRFLRNLRQPPGEKRGRRSREEWSLLISFYMGPGTRNPDGLAHGAVDDGSATFPFPAIPAGAVGVGFEGLLGGGDLDYDDLGFAFSNVRSSAVPEPASLLLLGSGLTALARARRRRARKSA